MLRCMSNYHFRRRFDDIPCAEYLADRKCWVAPLTSLPQVRAEFDGEIYYKTPLWKLLGKSAPEREETTFLGPEPVVPALTLTPYDYQNVGIKFMIDRLNNVGFVLNGDAVGLGKTIQSIGTMKWFVENRGARKILIICKKSIKTQWAEEIRRIADWQKIPIYVTGGTKKKRMDAYKGIQESLTGILITNYHNFLNDAEEINKVNYDVCVIDEAHCVKARDGKMNDLIGQTVSGKRTILLTGTPVMSKPDDIYGIVRMVAPNYFGTYEDFKARYIRTEFGIYGEQIIGAWHLDELQERIQNFLIMRTADEVALELPKREAKKIVCDMDATQRRMQTYIETRQEKLKAQKEDILRQYGLNDRTKDIINKMVDREKVYNATLQFIADDPAVFRYTRSAKKGSLNDQLKSMLPESYKMSAKTEAAVDLISEIIDAGEKAIVFCHWASAARMLRDRFSKIEGASVVMYTGAESDEQRDMNVASFKFDPAVNIIIGTEAMAEGLNLQVCPFLINYEQADTHAIKEQRIGRIHRIGSRYDYINVIDLITNNSKDTTKLSKIERDKDISSALLAGA